ncbi:MAG: VOC family protein [Tannerellaceae bacterium]|nr:VOC family protein [Tannerellaceae bacterium]
MHVLNPRFINDQIQVDPYLSFNGNCEEAFTWYKGIFQTEFNSFVRYKEMTEGPLMPEQKQNKIIYISMPISDYVYLTGADTTPEMPVQMGENMVLTLTLTDEDQMRQIFLNLAEGGEILMPLQQTFWADLYGMIQDKFGIRWRINYKLGHYI